MNQTIQQINKEFDDELSNIGVNEIERGDGEFLNISIKEGKHPDWIMGVQDGFIFCQNKAKILNKKSLIKLLEKIIEEDCNKEKILEMIKDLTSENK